MKQRNRRRLAAAVAVLAVAIGLVFGVEQLRWRAQVVAMKAAGNIEGIGWSDLLANIRPGSAIYLRELVETPNAYAAISNPYATESGHSSEGALLFETRCAACHGQSGTGQTAPSLVGRALKFGDADWSLFKTITEGRAELGMPPAGISDRDAWQIVSHLRALRNGWTALAEAHSSVPAPAIDLEAKRIAHAGEEPQNWLTYSGNYASWRYSSLDEITTANVTDLKLAWSLQIATDISFIESTPIVVDGAMFVTSPLGDVIAVDAATGEVLWRYASLARPDGPSCCGPINRGVAVLGGRVYVGTFDSRVVALDGATGKVEWEVEIADALDGYSITVAPLAVRDKIIVGISGGEVGIRGFLDAYDADTGERAWRFDTIPAPGEPGSETWEGDAWRTGGGGTWVTGSFDPELGLLYWGVGNPSPDFNGDVRPGDNLYTNSVIALDVDTGELAWHFQFTPHDEHDWDSNQIPVLVDLEVDGAMRPLMLWGNRNGFYYVLDRATGEFIHATPFVKQTWAEKIDAHGRPVVREDAAPSPRGTLTWPGLSGGGNWWSPSYSPRTGLVYIPFAEGPNVFFKKVDIERVERALPQQFLGSAYVGTGEPLQAGIRALDPLTGAVQWEYLRLRPRRDIGWIGGVLSTAGNLAFVGDLHDFVAFDAASGSELWRINLGGHVRAAPMSFSVGGHQHIAIPAGKALFVFRL
jgi:alcohol dehydrogenase (cytochrome c)